MGRVLAVRGRGLAGTLLVGMVLAGRLLAGTLLVGRVLAGSALGALRQHSSEGEVDAHAGAGLAGGQRVVPHLVGGRVHEQQAAVLQHQFHCSSTQHGPGTEMLSEVRVG